ncbi:MAG: hypothetical protein FWE00_07465 [Defluviitaleaceae bacterium]|nr:hypothetical protein [Defluviitaleaceae bacterium]
MKYLLTVLLVLITIMQGGFSDAVWSLCGLVAALFLLTRARKRPPMPALVIMFPLIIAYAASAIIHGLPFESLAVVCRVMVTFLLFIAFYNIETDVSESVFIAGMVVAAIGFTSLCDVFYWNGAVISGRLQSVFQYANAAGFFLGVAAFLTRLNTKRSAFAPFIETALILTQSVGALIIYAAGWAIYLLKNKNVRFQLVLCGFAVSFFIAAGIYVLLFFSFMPQLGILSLVILLGFHKKLSLWVEALAKRRWFCRLGGAACLFAAWAVFLTRGLRPFATYIERLIHIWDGLRVIFRHPLGIGPGIWQYELFAHQSSLYSASKIHSEYIAAGVDAGFLAIAASLIFIIYWLKNMHWDGKAVCVIMVLLSAVMDISFSFLSITMVTVWLIVLTLPKSQTVPASARALFLLPLALCSVVFVQSAMKNHAGWIALTDPPAAAEILERLYIRNDTGAALSRISIYLYMERHDLLEAVFEDLPHPGTIAHAQMTRSLMRRELYEEAAESVVVCIESGPHRLTGYRLLEQILPHLDGEMQNEYRRKADLLIPEVNPLFAYIQAMEGR